MCNHHTQPHSMTALKEYYNQIIGMIIRPPRMPYSVAQLGPQQFALRNERFTRTDFQVLRRRTPDDKSAPPAPAAAPSSSAAASSTRSASAPAATATAASGADERLRIECSFFGAASLSKATACNVVIYCHGNSGCRLDAMDIVPLLLLQGICVVALDFCGSGLSSGDYVTLGWNEQKDLSAVVAFLRSDKSPFNVARIALWGRSMGAVTTLLYVHKDPSIAAVVLDSPYSDLPLLCRQLVSHVVTIKIPGFAVSTGLKIVRSSVKSRAGVDISELTPIKFVAACQTPALFVHGEQDDFVQPLHTKALHELYGGDKALHLVEGDHNAPRPHDFQNAAMLFLCHAFRIEPRAAHATAGASAMPFDTQSLAEALEEAGLAKYDTVLRRVNVNAANLPPDAGALLLAEGLTIKEMKLALRHMDVVFDDCVEKQDLAERLIVTMRARNLIGVGAAAPKAPLGQRDADELSSDDSALDTALTMSRLDQSTTLAPAEDDDDAVLQRVLALSLEQSDVDFDVRGSAVRATDADDFNPRAATTQTAAAAADSDGDDDDDAAALAAAIALSTQQRPL
jgi:pimeloyl-ACP methyl ester carboxylesterase